MNLLNLKSLSLALFTSLTILGCNGCATTSDPAIAVDTSDIYSRLTVADVQGYSVDIQFTESSIDQFYVEGPSDFEAPENFSNNVTIYPLEAPFGAAISIDRETTPPMVQVYVGAYIYGLLPEGFEDFETETGIHPSGHPYVIFVP